MQAAVPSFFERKPILSNHIVWWYSSGHFCITSYMTDLIFWCFYLTYNMTNEHWIKNLLHLYIM